MSEWRGEVKELDAVAPDEIALWDQLCKEHRYLRSPFFSFTFSACVARAKPNSRVCLLYRGASLVGFFPFQFENSVAWALGAGERIGGPLNDSFGIIGGPTSAISHTDLLRCAQLNYFSVSHLESEQQELGLVGQRKHLGYSVKLSEGAEDYWSKINVRHRDKLKNLLNRERKIERDFKKVTFIFDEQDPLSVLDLVIAEKRAQYARTAVGDALQLEWMRNCLKEIAAQANELCRPVVSSLYLDGEWAALHFGIRSPGVMHYWFPVYNQNIASLSPGLILLRKIINHCPEHGIGEIDLGEGDAPYKVWLGTHEYANSSGEWTLFGARSFTYKALRAASWRIKALRKPSSEATS